VRFAEQAEDRLGGTIDIVVANAGGPPPGLPTTTSLDGYRDALALIAQKTKVAGSQCPNRTGISRW